PDAGVPTVPARTAVASVEPAALSAATGAAPVEPAVAVPAPLAPAGDAVAQGQPPPEPAAPARTVVETNDNEAVVVVEAGGEPSASLSATSVLREGADEIRLYVYGDVAAGVLAVEVELTNGSAGTIAFPGGVRAQVTITRDGVAWRTLELQDASIGELAPGGALTLHATVPGADGRAAYGFGVSVGTLQA
ncbi:MAG: hypothetical protein ACRDJO_04025, partial [Actinomycetota bacterium]